jgi:hypothetical protein
MIEKTDNPNFVNELSLCHHRTVSGRHCRLRHLNPQSHLPRSAVDIAGQTDENPPIPNVTDWSRPCKKRKFCRERRPFVSNPLRGGKKV